MFFFYGIYNILFSYYLWQIRAIITGITVRTKWVNFKDMNVYFIKYIVYI